MGQDMNECVTILEDWVGAVVAEDWLPTSTDGMYSMFSRWNLKTNGFLQPRKNKTSNTFGQPTFRSYFSIGTTLCTTPVTPSSATTC